MSTPPITRWAGRISLAAAALILTSQLLNLALYLTLGDDPATATVTQTLKYALALLAQYVLLLALTGLYARQATAVGTLGLVDYLVAFLGTLLVAGDWWYEAFVGPGIALHAPQLVDMPYDASLVAGAVATNGLFSLGWILFGIATLRGRLLPAGPAILMIIGGAVGALVLWTPYQIPLAIAVGWMGYRLSAASHDQHDAPAPAPANP
jgi:hypothetical protein